MTTDKVVWCDNGWFRGVFYYAFCPSEKAWKREMKILGQPNEPYPRAAAHCMRLTNSEGKCCVLVTVADGLENNHSALEIACLIFHEAVHVWQFLKQRVGEEEPGAEMEAYSLQSIAQELISAFEKTRRYLHECDKQ